MNPLKILALGAFILLERLLESVSFSAGEQASETIRVDAAYVDKKLANVAGNEDLNRFIL